MRVVSGPGGRTKGGIRGEMLRELVPIWGPSSCNLPSPTCSTLAPRETKEERGSYLSRVVVFLEHDSVGWSAKKEEEEEEEEDATDDDGGRGRR